MAEKMLKWKLDDTDNMPILTVKHKPSQSKESFPLMELFVNVAWEDLEAVEKSAMAYAVQQKLSDLVAGKGKKAGYSGSEIFALMRNKWDSLTVDRIWSQKSGERSSPQKKLSAMKIISQSMAKAAPLLGLKIAADVKIVSDEEYETLTQE